MRVARRMYCPRKQEERPLRVITAKHCRAVSVVLKNIHGIVRETVEDHTERAILVK